MMIVERILRLQKIKKIKDDNKMSSFWSNKPVELSVDNDVNILHTKDDILIKVDKEITTNRFKLQYTVLDGNHLDSDKIHEMVSFINKNYVQSYDESYTLVYTKELFNFYCKDCIILEFYPLNGDKKVGYIVGKKSTVSIYNKLLDTSEVNFLCIIPALRSLGLASYMINVLTKEIITKYDVITSHYTISVPIKSPYFAEKHFYHRFLNQEKLQNINFIRNFNTKYNIFNYHKRLKGYNIQYLNGNIDDKLSEELYNSYKKFCKKSYDIYEIVTLHEFQETFLNKMFHHFIIYDQLSKIVAYVSLFRLDTCNIRLNQSIKTGYYYYMFFDDKTSISSYLEYINQYMYEHGIFDILTFTDIFDINYNDINCVKGSSYLRYYFYNLKIPQINNQRNGMITI